MPCTEPATRSPGKLALVYNYSDATHRCSANFIDGVDIEDVAAIRVDAAAFAAKVKDLIPATATINAWEIVLPDGFVGYSEPFDPVITGTAVGGGTAYKSVQETLSGNGVEIGVGGCRGKTRFTVFPRNAGLPSAGEKRFNVAESPAWTALASYFHTNLRIFADYYGQHAEPKSYVTTQFNAHIQKTEGS